MSMIVVKSFAASLAGIYAETHYGPNLGTGAFGLSRAFGATPLILTGMSFWTLLHGFLYVGKARSKFIELAKKDGEKDVEERYNLPNLYAQGTSKHAKAFNCAQRSHQQIFETFPYFCLLSMLGAVHYPITSAVATLAYSYGRIQISLGYANEDADPAKRYSRPFASLMWYGLLMNIAVSAVSCISFMVGEPVL